MSYMPMLPRSATGVVASDPKSVARGVLLSFALHALIAMLLAYAVQQQLRPPARQSIRAVVITPSIRQGEQTMDLAQAMPSSPAPATPPVANQPKPVSRTAPPAAAQPDTPAAKRQKPSPAKQEPNQAKTRDKSAEASKAIAATSPAPTDKAGADTDEDADSLLTRLRGNWLAPPRAAPIFRCRVQISYRAGGIVTAATVQQGCGDPALADSVERAVWKTQPLPLPPGSPAAGTIDIEFSP